MSWNDAQGSLQWLSQRTGQTYRLPTEAEWEYAARAGTVTPFWTAATISTAQANYDGIYTYGAGAKDMYRQATVAVRDPAFPANPFGPYHVHGNVGEWVQDCYLGSTPKRPLKDQRLSIGASAQGVSCATVPGATFPEASAPPFATMRHR